MGLGNGEQRWAYIFGDPNVSAAFVLPLIFASFSLAILTRAKSTRYVSLLLTAVFTFLLLKTGSRSGLLALGAGGICFFLPLGYLLRSDNERGLLRAVFLRGCVYFLILGFAITVWLSWEHTRLSGGWSLKDGSSTNRLAVWLSACDMIVASKGAPWPMNSWRADFENWFLPYDLHETYLSPLNSLLDVTLKFGIETALVALTCLSIIFGLSIAWWCKSGQPISSLEPVCMFFSTAVIISFAAVNMFSTLWTYSVLWIFPVMAVVLILRIVSRAQRETWRLGLILGCSISCLTMLFIVLTGSSRNDVLQVTKTKSGVRLTVGEGLPHGQISATVLLGTRYSDSRYGKVFRQALARKADAFSIEVSSFTNGATLDPSVPLVLMADAHIHEFSRMSLPSKILVVLPVGVPRDAPNLFKAKVYLPEFDMKGQNLTWIQYSETSEWDVTFCDSTTIEQIRTWDMVLANIK